MGFRPGLVGPFPSVEDGFELCGWLFVEVGVQAAGASGGWHIARSCRSFPMSSALKSDPGAKVHQAS